MGSTTTITITTKVPALPTTCNVPTAINTINAMSSAPTESLPLLRDVPVAERTDLFIAKLHLCSRICDFRDPTSSLKEKHIKKKTLMELVEFISSGSAKITEVLIKEGTKMVAVNLFRSLPHPMHDNRRPDIFDKEVEEPMLEPAWPHLQIVYDFFLFFITSADMDVKTARLYVDNNFILKLMDLFASEDSRERQYLKTILHRIYGKFMVHRPFIKKAMNDIFHRLVSESERHQGIAEFLEVLGSIINGFSVPLKEEHKTFLKRALMPLHKAKCFHMYHYQLCYCMTQYIAKDIKLAEIIIKSLLKYWPRTNSHKEFLFLGELEEVLVSAQLETLEDCVVPLFKQVGRCLSSLHFQVAERALSLCINESVVNFIRLHRAVVLPIVVPALECNDIGHWNHVIDDMKMNLRKLYLDMDLALYQRCQGSYIKDQANVIAYNTNQMLSCQRTDAMASIGGTMSSGASAGLLLAPTDVQ